MSWYNALIPLISGSRGITAILLLIPLFRGIPFPELKKDIDGQSPEILRIPVYGLAIIFYILIRFSAVVMVTLMGRQIDGVSSVGSIVFVAIADGLYWMITGRINSRWHEAMTSKIFAFFVIEFFYLFVFYAGYVSVLVNILPG